jgi:hypothetical protein
MDIEIRRFDPDPRIDPYHRDTQQLTATRLVLTPERNYVVLEQDEDDNATTEWEWHGRDIVIPLDAHETGAQPDADALRELLISEEGQSVMWRIIDGYDLIWDGNNHRGGLTETGDAALTELVEMIADIPRDDTETWACDEWFSGEERQYVNADSTPDEITTAAAQAVADARENGQRFADDVETHLTEWVEQARRN